MMENGHFTSHIGLPKYKLRRVSSVRDFPRGCGRFAVGISLRPDKEDAPNNAVENLEGRYKDGNIVLSETGFGIHSSPVLQSSVRLEMLGQQNTSESEFERLKSSTDPKYRLMSMDIKQMEVLDLSEGVGGLDNDRMITPLGAFELETCDVVNNFCQFDVAALDEELFPPSGLRLLSLYDHSTATVNGNVLEKTVARSYPPRRRVSAVRDFPPNCGTNVPCLSKERHMEVLDSSERRRLGEEKFDDEIPRLHIQTHHQPIGQQFSPSENHLQDEDSKGLEVPSERRIVIGLMAASNSPWSLVKGDSKANMAGGIAKSTGKKHHPLLQERFKSAVRPRKVRAVKSGGTFSRHSSSSSQNDFQAMHQLVLSDVKNAARHESHVGAHNIDVSLPPSGPFSLIGRSNDGDGIVTRNRVRETLRLFQALCRKLLKEAEAKPAEQHRRIYCQAAKILKENHRYINTDKQIIGSVPGVEVGDEFQYRLELNIIGLHRQTQCGIDYMKQGGIYLAVSVVASGGYDNELESDVLIYTGSGGNVVNGGNKEHVDQKLERGNLALANSKNAQNPVRVIRGEDRAFDTSDAKGRTYVYDGLYLVEHYWEQIAPHGSKVFKFRLTRIPGQLELAWKEVKQSKKFKVRKGVCVDDISQGKERIPIYAVNSIDDEKLPSFKYVTSMIYPDWYHALPSKGCDCLNGCSESGKCSCVAKNGGEIPYNHNGAIVKAKPLVFECGPSCKCPRSCHNRVSQLGIKFQLEIFKTESRGWGMRSLDFIPSGSFLCEYVGELLEENEAEKRAGYDEYLFDIGNNYNDGNLWNELSTMMQETQSTSHEIVECGGFTIDAARYGNIGRFINHSCSPNLYAQNVLYDHGDKRIPHIMLFAVENIPPLKELTYHYNYKIDQVYDSDGNIKKKSCYCGSSECTGRMY